MRINSYNIGMESARLYKSSTISRKYVESHESALTGAGSQLSSFNSQTAFDNPEETNESNRDEVLEKAMNDLSSNKYLFGLSEERASITASRASYGSKAINERNLQNEFQKMHQLMIKYIYELMFGGKAKNKKGYSDEATSEDEANNINPVNSIQNVSIGSAFKVSSAFTVTQNIYQVTEFTESESTSFQAKGIVKTDDGREINLNINVSMSRTFSSVFSEEISTATYELHDPLVINLKDAPASLSDMTFFFDIDMDGSKEELSMLSEGSGFLALDKNEDGIINDGSELFGPNSGNGFKDLQAYDEDGNGWIDENDSIFEKLKIWTKDLDGNDILYSLKSQDVGAIYLGSAQTDFAINAITDNSTKGYIRETGVFLHEDGRAGTIQHVDLAS